MKKILFMTMLMSGLSVQAMNSKAGRDNNLFTGKKRKRSPEKSSGGSHQGKKYNLRDKYLRFWILPLRKTKIPVTVVL